MRRLRLTIGAALVAAAALCAVGVSTDAILTNTASSSNHVDTKFTTVATVVPNASETGAGAGPATSVSPDGQYVVYRGTGVSGKAVVFRISDVTAQGSAATPYRTVSGLTGSTGQYLPACWSTDSTKLYAFSVANPSTAKVLTVSTGAVATASLAFQPEGCTMSGSYVYVGDAGAKTLERVSATTGAQDTSWEATPPAGGAVLQPVYTDGTYVWSSTMAAISAGYLCRTTVSSESSSCGSGVGHEIHSIAVDPTGPTFYMVSTGNASVEAYNLSLVKTQTISFSGTQGIRVAESADKTTLVVTSDAGCPVLDISQRRQTALLPSCGSVAAAGTQNPTLFFTSNSNQLVGMKW